MSSPPVRPIVRDELAQLAQPVSVERHRMHDCSSHARSAPPVTHSYAALAFFTAGRARMEQRGQWEVSAGDVVLVPAGQPHRALEREGAELWGLSFCAPCLAVSTPPSLLAPLERVRDGGAAVVRIPEARRAFLATLFQELEGALAEPQRELEARAATELSLLTLILSEVERATPGPSAPALTAAPSVVAVSLRFIERNCLRPLTLQDVAAAVGRSPAYVTSALSRATGRSAVEWIIAMRMAEARRLLLRSQEPVDAIAERVGYADATHFIRMFRRASGVTPAAFRAEMRQPPAATSSAASSADSS